MKRILMTIMMLLLVVTGMAYGGETADAVGKTMYVNAKSDVILRDKPAKNAKQITKVKNNSAVTVLSTTKNWSYIQTGKHKGYVYSSALSVKDPNKKVVSELETVKSYAMKGTTPNTAKIKIGHLSSNSFIRGDSVPTMIKAYGNPKDYETRRGGEVFANYKNFTVTYYYEHADYDENIYKSLRDNNTEIDKIFSRLSKGYTLNELKKVFGNDYDVHYGDNYNLNMIPNIDMGTVITISYTLENNQYIQFYLAQEIDYGKGLSESQLSKLIFEKYVLY